LYAWPYLSRQRPKVQLGGIKEYVEKLKNIDRIIIVACGTSWHAGLVGEYLIEEYARIRLRWNMLPNLGTVTLSYPKKTW
jgi:glucosamine 6-phosphate synthetase-like amidotransferase/phosphosugar isomerase protein